MTKTLTRTSVLSTASLALLLVITFALRTHGAEAVDCVGKPYGYPGCPLRPTPSTGTASSTSGFCGNAIVDDGEQCDKGRFNGKTDCSLDCKVLFCGDGTVSKDIGEECEPETQEYYIQDASGNLTTDIRFVGNSQCGWYCQPPTCTDAGTCSGGCKLKYIDDCPADSSSSASVDGPAAAGTGSLTASSSSSSSSVVPVCGDGVREGSEQCDDGNKDNNDGCSNACELPRCGDGLRQPQEQCDDGAKNSDTAQNACRTDCTLPRCGDGVMDKGEQCDTGTRNSDALANACRSNCMAPVCGDGVVDKGEQCDAGTQNSDTKPDACRSTCKLPTCGDSILDAAEQCDDGNRVDSDACTNACKRPGCGDGIVQTGEQCDWGTKNSDKQPDACRTSCTAPRCGDGVVDKGEECDRGSNCSSLCTFTSGIGSSRSSAASSKQTIHAAAPAPSDSGNFGMTIAILLGVSGSAVVLSSILFRRRIVAMFAPAGMKSIDDIPLDQIEMPWHKW